MANSDRKPRLPEPGEYIRNVGELVEVQDVTPPPVAKVEDWIFRDTEARIEMRVNGKTVKRFSTYNNYYGRETCVETAINEAKEQATFYGPAAGVEIVVVKVTSLCRYRPRRDRNLYSPEFVRFEAEGNGGLPEPVEEDIWSSVRGDLRTATTEPHE